MAPEVAALFKSFRPDSSRPRRTPMSKSPSPRISRAMPAVTAAMFAAIKNKIGIAVAIYATDHPGDWMESQVCWIDIARAQPRESQPRGSTRDDSRDHLLADGFVRRRALPRRGRHQGVDGWEVKNETRRDGLNTEKNRAGIGAKALSVGEQQ